MMRFTTFISGVLGITAALALSSCELQDNPSDHDVPPGKGSLIVDNQTGDSIAVYLDGTRMKDVGDYDDRAYDLDPDVCRVVLDQRSGSRSYVAEVDVLEGRRTVLRVTIPIGDNEYDVETYFD